MIAVKHIYILGIAVALIIGASIMGAAYIWSSKQVAVHDQLKQDTKERVEETKKSDQEADTKLRERKQTISRTSEKVKTPTDVVAALPLINSPFSGIVAVKAPENPDAPSQLIVLDPKAFFDAAAECAGSKAEFEACSVKLDNANKRAELQEKRAESAEKIMKGGGFFNRLKSGLKHSLCGGTGGVSGIYVASKTKPGVGVAVGVGSFLGCELVLK